MTELAALIQKDDFPVKKVTVEKQENRVVVTYDNGGISYEFLDDPKLFLYLTSEGVEKLNPNSFLEEIIFDEEEVEDIDPKNNRSKLLFHKNRDVLEKRSVIQQTGRRSRLNELFNMLRIKADLVAINQETENENMTFGTPEYYGYASWVEKDGTKVEALLMGYVEKSDLNDLTIRDKGFSEYIKLQGRAISILKDKGLKLSEASSSHVFVKSQDNGITRFIIIDQ